MYRLPLPPLQYLTMMAHRKTNNAVSMIQLEKSVFQSEHIIAWRRESSSEREREEKILQLRAPREKTKLDTFFPGEENWEFYREIVGSNFSCTNERNASYYTSMQEAERERWKVIPNPFSLLISLETSYWIYSSFSLCVPLSKRLNDGPAKKDDLTRFPLFFQWDIERSVEE